VVVEVEVTVDEVEEVVVEVEIALVGIVSVDGTGKMVLTTGVAVAEAVGIQEVLVMTLMEGVTDHHLLDTHGTHMLIHTMIVIRTLLGTQSEILMRVIHHRSVTHIIAGVTHMQGPQHLVSQGILTHVHHLSTTTHMHEDLLTPIWIDTQMLHAGRKIHPVAQNVHRPLLIRIAEIRTAEIRTAKRHQVPLLRQLQIRVTLRQRAVMGHQQRLLPPQAPLVWGQVTDHLHRVPVTVRLPRQPEASAVSLVAMEL